MATLYTQADSNIRKTRVYLVFFLAFVIAIGWLLSYYLRTAFFVWFAVIYSVATSVASYWYSDKIVLALSGAKPVEKAQNPELYRIVENLAITAGLPMPKIYILNEAQPNAFATGRDADHAVVVVTSGLLERLEKTELEGVLAHELSHIGNKDAFLATVVVVLVGVVAIMTNLFFRISFWGGASRREEGEGKQTQWLIGIVTILVVILAPVIATMLKLAISRKREFLADETGALLTRYPEGLARALEKISQDPAPLKAANDATLHLYIVNPLRGGSATSWIHKLFMTHPPIEERIAALRGMKMNT